MSRELHLAGFLIASHVTHSHAAWRHPGSETDYLGPGYYRRVVRTLERGKFDFLFFADLLATPVRYGDDIRVPLRSGTQASATIDPALVAALPADATDHLGLAITKSTKYFHSYEVARIFGTLDHLSRGRAAWNVVTSLNQAGFGPGRRLTAGSPALWRREPVRSAESAGGAGGEEIVDDAGAVGAIGTSDSGEPHEDDRPEKLSQDGREIAVAEQGPRPRLAEQFVERPPVVVDEMCA